MKKTIAGLLLFTACATTAPHPSTDEIVAAEHAFAQTSIDEGQREAWLRWFADDGIMFAPGPVNAKEATAKRPVEQKPFPATLFWAPAYGAIARSGELGFNTGPWRIRDAKGERADLTGYFFSIWKKQPGDTWRVALDLGVQTKTEGGPDNAMYVATRFGEGKPAANGEVQELDRATPWLLHDRVWLLRDARPPMRSAAEARAYLDANPLAVLTPLGGDVARSGDLAYTYGTYVQGTARGNYARVWARDDGGQWKVAMDVANTVK